MQSKILSTTLICAALSLSHHAAATDCHVTQSAFGVLASGEAVHAYTIANAQLKVTLLSHGGVLYEIQAKDRDGKAVNVISNLDSLRTYESHAVFSSLVGRYAGRIGGGGFTLDGLRVDLKSAPNGVTTHGGPLGFGQRQWQAKVLDCGVRLSLTDPDGENGFPGELKVAVDYLLHGADLTLDYHATTSKPTVFNPTHHVYFNLAGAGAIDRHQLSVNADRWLATDENKVPTGALLPVAGALDLRHPVVLGPVINAQDHVIRATNGLDHTFVLNGQDAALLKDPASGRTLRVKTSSPGMVVYSANFFDGSRKDAAGRPLVRNAAVALETQHHSNSPNLPHFPSTVLRPGKPFHAWTTFRFGID